MKKLLITVLFVSWLVNISCNNSNGPEKNSNTRDSNTESSQTTKGDKRIITCLIDGKQRTFNVQQGFFEISLGVDPNGAKDGLEILDGDAKKEGFQFEFKKSGTTKIKTDATGDMNCIINYYNPKGVTYTGADATVVVSSYDQNHLTGTFSGKLVNAYYDEGTNGAKNYPQYIEVTNGKFDLNR